MERSQPRDPAVVRDAVPNLLIADVAALTGVAPPQLRSWEAAGLLQPRRLPNGTRLYSPEDVARARLIARSLVNPGRRGSLRRLRVALSRGDLQPIPEDYAGLAPASAALSDALYWRSVVESMPELVIVCDLDERVTAMNPALRALLERQEPAPNIEALPSALRTLPLRWSALTGTRHSDLALTLTGPDGLRKPTIWSVAPLRAEAGAVYGAIGVGHLGPPDPAGQADWMAIAAHDLRSPVTVILGRLELARSTAGRLAVATEGDQSDARDMLERHLAAATRATIDLIRAMDTLLDASAAAAGALVAQLEPDGVELDAIARAALDHAREHTSRHALGLEVSGEPLLVAGDNVRLRQVFDNLLANAIKYAPGGGPITVSLEAVAAPPRSGPYLGPTPGSRPAVQPGDPPRWALVRVRDTGLGIPAEAVPYVFDRFWRAAGPARQVAGSGLGLYTCRAIAAAHGGHIWVEESVTASGNDGEAQGRHGTVIALLLPLVRSPRGGGPHTADSGAQGQIGRRG